MKTVFYLGSEMGLPVGKILCLGRNYAEHAKEMKSEVPSEPVVFIKPSTAIIGNGGEILLPSISRELHHEVEMVMIISKAGKNIPQREAYGHIGGYAVGLDMTLRDVQSEAKQKGLPWSVAKGFDTSAPVSSFKRKDEVPNPAKLGLTLKVNGEMRQKGNTSGMLFQPDFLVSYLSTIFTLEPGDLIFTGTPEGVGKVSHGDVLEAELESVGTLRVSVH